VRTAPVAATTATQRTTTRGCPSTSALGQECLVRTGTGAGGLTASSRKRGHASGADAGEGAKHVLEFTSVNGGNVEQDVVGSGDGLGAQHIRQAVQCPCELGVTGFGMFSEGDEDEGFDAQFDLLVINDGSDSLDSAVAAELLDPSEGGGGRKPETAGELDVRQVAAYL
jgi:hypothetical protein